MNIDDFKDKKSEIHYQGDVDKAICFLVTTTDECDNTYLGTEGPFWDKAEMEEYVKQESHHPGVDQIIIHCIVPPPGMALTST